MTQPITRVRRAAAALLLAVPAVTLPGCQNFLDVNTNPNTPEVVSANLYLPGILHWWVTAPAFDGRFLGRYTQMWMLPGTSTTPSTWDRMGYDPGSDNGAEQWRDVYWSFGQNLIDMMTKAQAEERWDILGVGYLMKAWGWLVLTDMHGPIIKLDQVFDQSRLTFDYDTEDHQYEVVLAELDSAITFLERTDGAVDATYLRKGDLIYGGDRSKWLKAAWGVKALALNHLSNKGALYQPQDVIAAVDKSFGSNADDALLPYQATNNDNTNFYGRTRGNLPSYRQTYFPVGLMDGTQFSGAVDPRMRRMLSPSPDGVYRGLDPNVGNALVILPATQRPNNVFGYPGTGGLALPSRYIFSDKSKFPQMTYAELQFVKAEAAYRAGNPAVALSAYTTAIGASIDFVNARNADDGQSGDHTGAPESNITQISSAERAAFLADTRIVPATPAGLTLSHIMSQKYVALWGWGHNEIWVDMRRYHYTDLDPVSGTQVFRGFKLPTNYYVDNAGKPVYRVRPRFNSEYVWNKPGLSQVGALDADYHTKPVWILQP